MIDRLAWALYRVIRRALLRGLGTRDRAEMDELVAVRLRAARDGHRSVASVWVRELFDLGRSLRRAPRLPRIRFSWLDVKLGLRILVKQPGLTCVAVFALGVGIPVGMAPWYFVNAIMAPLPVEAGERIQLLRYWDVAGFRPESTTVYDLERWREELTAFEVLAAARSGVYDVGARAGGSEPVAGAEVTASSFEMLRVPPLMGRTLVGDDEAVGGPAVVVIGYELWRSRLGGDSEILGRSIEIGGEPMTVVGVMPAGFGFPVRHQLWFPLRVEPASTPREGMRLLILGRLATGATPAAAQAQLTAIGERMANEFPETHAALRPEVVPAAFMVFGFPRGGLFVLPEFLLGQVVAFFLLLVACTNVGMLIFARTTSRSTELAVRTALGASRARIVTQVFTESLVLAVVAAGAGLLLLHWLPARLLAGANLVQRLPYWVEPGVTPSVALAAVALAAFSASVTGVVPALRATGRAVQWNIHRASVGPSRSRFGGWTSWLIVADVAVAVMAVGPAIAIWDVVSQTRDADEAAGIQADQYLSARVRLLDTAPIAGGRSSAREQFRARVEETQRELVRRLAAEPGVRAVTVASALPRMDHTIVRVDIDGQEPADGYAGPLARVARVDIGFFDALEKPILAGRGFAMGDMEDGVAVAIVNTAFVDRVLGGRNPIGLRVRYRRYGAVEPSDWHEIVGVVGRLGMHVLDPDQDQGLYLPAAPGDIHPLQLAIHLGNDPESFTPRLRALVREVDSTAVLESPTALSKLVEEDWYVMVAVTIGGGILVVILLAMAASGLYAIMSSTVARRTREIGIRSALGASRISIALTVARRSLAQIAAGVLLGMPLAGMGFLQVADGEPSGVMQAVGGALMLGVGVMVAIALVACAAPTLRALRVTPTEALREGG